MTSEFTHKRCNLKKKINVSYVSIKGAPHINVTCLIKHQILFLTSLVMTWFGYRLERDTLPTIHTIHSWRRSSSSKPWRFFNNSKNETNPTATWCSYGVLKKKNPLQKKPGKAVYFLPKYHTIYYSHFINTPWRRQW